LVKILKQNKSRKNVFYWALGVPQKSTANKKRYALQEDPLEKTLSYHAANCCRPIPGDQIMAFTQNDGEVLIHKNSCPVAIQDAARFGDRIVDAEWQKHVYSSFLVRISIRGIDRLGILNDITQYITLVLSINIRKVIIETHDGIFEGHVDLYVHNTEEVDRLMKNIQKIQGVEFVSRTDLKDL